MTSRSRSRSLAGAILFLFINASFVFLILSPCLENPGGRYLEKRTLGQVEQQIRAVRQGDFILTLRDADGAPLKNRRLVYRQTGHDFWFGCNLFEFNRFDDPRANERYREYFQNLFNLAVLPFYWREYEPAPGNFPRAEFLQEALAWCEQNGITPKGHPLAWRNPAGYPDWLPADPGQVAKLLQARIEGVVQEYRGRIQIWDVVNEPTHLPPFGSPDTFAYVASALRWAHARDPAALLTVNDYGILGHDFGHGPYYRLLKRLIQSRAPINLIGLQGREPRTDWIPAYEIRATLEAYSRLGLPIHLTEITVPSADLPITNSWKKGVWTEDDQADYLERFYKICFSQPGVEAIIYWDLYDGASWIKHGGLIRDDWKPKPAYQRLDRLLNREWRSRGSGMTDENGELAFTGFYGAYEIEIPDLGKKVSILAPRNGANHFLVTLAPDSPP